MTEDFARGIVEVFGQEEVGTGFVLAKDLIVTCAHVVGSASAKPSVVFYGTRTKVPVTVLPDLWCSEEQGDIAVLQCTGGVPENVESLFLGRSCGTDGHSCRALGYPDLPAVQGVRGEGTIRGPVLDRWGARKLQVSSKEITSGFSGAPLLDETTQRVVGMIVWQAEPDRVAETAFAISAETLYELLRPHFPQTLLHPSRAVESYLARMRDYCVRHPYEIWGVQTHNEPSPKTLGEVYVPLRLRFRPPETSGEDKGQGAQAPQAGPTREEVQGLPAAEMLRHAGKSNLLILGGPGAGKSTLLRQFAVYAWDAPGIIGLDVPHIPLLIPLSALAAGEESQSLEKRFTAVINGEYNLIHDLPEKFLTDWKDQAGARWLFLLDALDEVPDSRRRKLLGTVRHLSRDLPESRVVITSRPSGYSPGELDRASFSPYEVEPFTPAQEREFADKWFGERAGEFLKALAKLEAGDLKSTPLLLTIGAKIYLGTGTVPADRAALYRELIKTALEEAEEKGLNRELREKQERLAGPAKLHIARLSYLAWRMIEASVKVSSSTIAGFIQDHLQTFEKFEPLQAETCCEEFLHVMGRRSGVLIRKGNSYEFLHPTVRDYLTGLHLLRVGTLDQAVKQYWKDSRYDDALAFLLSAATAEGKQEPVAEALNRLIAYGEETYKNNPRELYACGRSPLRVALHLLCRSGLKLADFKELEEFLRTRILLAEPRQVAVALDRQTPPVILGWLSESGSERVRDAVAGNPGAPRATLVRLAEDKSPWVPGRVARNPSTPPEVLTLLAGNDNDDARIGVAKNPGTPPAALTLLAEDDRGWVRLGVAGNPSAPPGPLTRLAKDDRERVRETVAANPGAPPDLLRRLAEDDSKAVRGSVARNPGALPDLLTHLAEDSSEWVRQSVARNPRAPSEVLTRLGKEGNLLERMEVARNPGAPPGALTRLAEDSGEMVRVGVAGNPSTPPEVLKGLAKDESEWVRMPVARNPSTPREVLRRLAEDTSDAIRSNVGGNPSAPPEGLEVLAKAGVEFVRADVPRNPNVFLETL